MEVSSGKVGGGFRRLPAPIETSVITVFGAAHIQNI